MNNIGFGIFCFGEEYYFKGAIEKVKHILNEGYHCYILTDTPEYFTTRHSSSQLHVIQYDRNFKSYSDKMILPKYILRNHNIGILIDADTHIMDYTFLTELKDYQFKFGVSYVDSLLNHKSKREFVRDLVEPTFQEWKSYTDYAQGICPNYGDLETIWEYFIVINKTGFNETNFYHHYEKLQIAKEYCDIGMNKSINGPGEGISIQISSLLSQTEIQRDGTLFDIIKDKMISVSRRHTPKELWPEWMK
jgi:hypothetical protein